MESKLIQMLRVGKCDAPFFANLLPSLTRSELAEAAVVLDEAERQPVFTDAEHQLMGETAMMHVEEGKDDERHLDFNHPRRKKIEALRAQVEAEQKNKISKEEIKNLRGALWGLNRAIESREEREREEAKSATAATTGKSCACGGHSKSTTPTLQSGNLELPHYCVTKKEFRDTGPCVSGGCKESRDFETRIPKIKKLVDSGMPVDEAKRAVMGAK